MRPPAYSVDPFIPSSWSTESVGGFRPRDPAFLRPTNESIHSFIHPSIHQSIQPGQQGTEATNLPKGRVADKERDSIRRDPTRSDPIRLVLFYFISFRFVVVSFRDASACEQVSESVETIPVAINR